MSIRVTLSARPNAIDAKSSFQVDGFLNIVLLQFYCRPLQRDSPYPLRGR